jgi:hypothetical protein
MYRILDGIRINICVHRISISISMYKSLDIGGEKAAPLPIANLISVCIIVRVVDRRPGYATIKTWSSSSPSSKAYT